MRAANPWKEELTTTEMVKVERRNTCQLIDLAMRDMLHELMGEPGGQLGHPAR